MQEEKKRQGMQYHNFINVVSLKYIIEQRRYGCTCKKLHIVSQIGILNSSPLFPNCHQRHSSYSNFIPKFFLLKFINIIVMSLLEISESLGSIY